MESTFDFKQFQTFEEFMTALDVSIPVWGFVINLILTALLGHLLSKVYIRQGASLSNRAAFGGNFLLIAATTMVIITIVKSSLALSLGLVGALSIVRFRAAIKEPEELAYIFLVIAIGLGFGANQRFITIVGFSLIVLFIYLKNYGNEKRENENLILTVSTNQPEKVTSAQIQDILKKYCASVRLKRLDENMNITEASFIVEYQEINAFNQSKLELRQLDESVSISFIDNKGIL